ncbi:hypothetical protein AGLY_016336, partial [Aphis glycines]
LHIQVYNTKDSERSDMNYECFGFTMMCVFFFVSVSVYSIICRNIVSISNFGDVKSKYFSVGFKKSGKTKKSDEKQKFLRKTIKIFTKYLCQNHENLQAILLKNATLRFLSNRYRENSKRRYRKNVIDWSSNIDKNSVRKFNTRFSMSLAYTYYKRTYVLLSVCHYIYTYIHSPKYATWNIRIDFTNGLSRPIRPSTLVVCLGDLFFYSIGLPHALVILSITRHSVDLTSQLSSKNLRRFKRVETRSSCTHNKDVFQ